MEDKELERKMNKMMIENGYNLMAAVKAYGKEERIKGLKFAEAEDWANEIVIQEEIKRLEET